MASISKATKMKKEFKSVLIGDNICVVDEKAGLTHGDTVLSIDKRQEAQESIFVFDTKTDYSTYYNGRLIKVIAGTSLLPNLPRLVIKDEGTLAGFAEWLDIQRNNNTKSYSDMSIWGKRIAFEIMLQIYLETLPKSTALLIEVNSDGSPIVVNNEITAFKK